MKTFLRRLVLALAFSFTGAAPWTQSFVVANRADGTITVHRASDGTRLRTVPLPPGSAPPEPMYVVQYRSEVLVGDRANQRVVRFSKRDYSVLGSVPAGDGVFHMWSNGHQLWVNNDIEATSTVVQLPAMTVLATVPMPRDLVAQGYVPHDVFVGRAAYVSLVGGSGATDFVVRFDTSTLAETHRAPVGKDPHVFWDRRSDQLFVPSQNDNRVEVLRGDDLSSLQTLPQAGAHGVFLPPFTRTLLVTSLTGGGVDDLSAYPLQRGMLLPAQTTSTGIATAHNIAATRFGNRIAVTHSGATATKVSLYELDPGRHGMPQLRRLGDVDAGLNPFGLAAIH